MTHYLLFASSNYPCGGMHDCQGVHTTRAEAEAAMADVSSFFTDDYHVLQVPEMLVHVYDKERRYVGVTTLAKFMGDNDD